MIIAIGAFSAFLAVLTGAFGAHGLEKFLNESAMAVWHTSVTYHMSHSIALILLGLFEAQNKVKLKVARYGFMIGILLFSGSLYVLVLSGVRALGMITPFGGVAMMVGWFAFAWGSYRLHKQQSNSH